MTGGEATQIDSDSVGCGRFGRDDLEMLAIAQSDPSAPVVDGIVEHLPKCPACCAVVDRIVADNAFLHELARAASRASDSRAAIARLEAQREDLAASGGPISGYRLGAEIHRGAQGAVFRAEQIATRRTCAVKMLLGGRFAGDRELIRFEREVEVVARLRHPAIVTLYESGVSRDGEPWFAMELVEGERLDDFVRAHFSPPRQVAQLLRQIADGIAYAHRRGVIHRDLKPGNIVVDAEGVPRVLDFGLARLQGGDAPAEVNSATTMAGEFVGTFAYAAPEQLAGDPGAVDSRCDLYALGVVFYQCLVGRRPFEGARSIAELVAQKTGSVPTRPSALNGAIDGDLDVITLRLLAADPARRYVTADALVEDLERFLDGRPILAREDSMAYVVRKTLRRHWIASSAAAALMATILISGVALAFAYANAQRQRVRSERTLASFRDAVGSVNPEASSGSASLSVEQFLELIEANSANELSSEPAVLAGVRDTIGIVHLGFEDAPRAERALSQALAERRRLYANGECSREEVAESLHNMGRVCILQRKLTEAEAFYREALAVRSDVFGERDPRTMLTARHLASCLRRENRLDEALALYDALEVRALDQSGYPALDLAAIRNGRAFIYQSRGDLPRALSDFEDALDAIRGQLASDDYRVGRSLFNIASTQERLSMPVESLQNATQALEILRKRKGGDAATVVDVEKLIARLRSLPSIDPSVGPN